MFRYEKMQRGRFRQFSQIGIELLGASTPLGDVEVVLALHTFLRALGFDDLVIVLNNLGDPEDRDRFIDLLKTELGPHFGDLCGDCRRRWDENPLRILDCKVERCRELVASTTPVADVVGEEARNHVEAVAEGLAGLDVQVRRAPRLVRGLDYYLRTVFEVISPALGEDTVICGGGRYDRLISDLGGSAVPGIGFAIGTDRLVDVLPESFRGRVLGRPIVAVLPVGREAAVAGLSIARRLIAAGIDAPVEVTERSLKASLKWAHKIGAPAVVIVGEAELAAGQIVIRDLRKGDQETVPAETIVDAVRALISGARGIGE